MPTLDRRRSGILLHPTSLPGPHGIGDLGPNAYHFVDWLVAGGQTAWQILPLNPIGPGNSPYASVSAFAGSPLLVALEPLVEKGWLAPIAAAETERFDPRRVDFARVVPWRMGRLKAAAETFAARASAEDRADHDAYCSSASEWLDDYALFMALDEAARVTQTGSVWPQWDRGFALRTPQAITAARKKHATEIRFWKFVQWCFDRQWSSLKAYANRRGVQLIGDLPIFVAHHSADCWARPDLYFLDKKGMPVVVAGVPPDYFSATGQRWGNPLYDWSAMKRDGYKWWIARLRRQLELADVIRVDHFRGFAGYWEIPASCPSAVEGRWVPGPGEELFDVLRQSLGDLPVIAEDLGVITPDVVKLRDHCGFPGMRILQFAFTEDAANAYLPHNHVENCCVYSGTHDNDTTQGWWRTATPHERAFARHYLNGPDSEIHWGMIRCASASVARLAVFQMQDVLGLGPEHRMNTPGQIECWNWRFGWEMVGPEPAHKLAQVSAAYGRAGIGHLQLPGYPPDKIKP